MSKSRRNRAGGAERRRIYSGTGEPSLRSLWQRAECCGATIAADPGRMGSGWADVHEPGCPAPWTALGLDGTARDVYPGAPYLPDVPRLRAVNRRPGARPATPEHEAAQRRRA
jgi:hypothetical protein